MRFKYIGILALISLLMSSFLKTDNSEMTLFDFTKDADLTDWNILNDGVMGGVSSSTFTINEDGNGLFEGEVSTANNGGFASVRYNTSRIDVSESKSIKIRLLGDSKNYQFRVKEKSSDSESYITTFSTSGEWETIEIKLSDLYPSFRGRKLNLPNFESSSIEELSFLFANKKDESFKLEIDKIEIN